MTDISSACFSFSNHIHMYECWLCCVVFTQQIFMISFYLFFQVRFFPSSSFHIFWWPWQMSSDFLKLFYISEAFGVWNWMRVTDWGAGIEYNLTVSIEMSQNVQFQDRAEPDFGAVQKSCHPFFDIFIYIKLWNFLQKYHQFFLLF